MRIRRPAQPGQRLGRTTQKAAAVAVHLTKHELGLGHAFLRQGLEDQEGLRIVLVAVGGQTILEGRSVQYGRQRQQQEPVNQP